MVYTMDRYSYTLDNVAVGAANNPSSRKLHIFQSSNPGFSMMDGASATLELGVASCDGCYAPFAQTRDAVLRGGGTQSGNLILSTWSPMGGIKFGTGAGTSLERMSIDINGKVKIGSVTTPGDYLLYVEKGILTEQVCIALKNSENGLIMSSILNINSCHFLHSKITSAPIVIYPKFLHLVSW